MLLDSGPDTAFVMVKHLVTGGFQAANLQG
jgi:hypothetical protein